MLGFASPRRFPPFRDIEVVRLRLRLYPGIPSGLDPVVLIYSSGFEMRNYGPMFFLQINASFFFVGWSDPPGRVKTQSHVVHMEHMVHKERERECF